MDSKAAKMQKIFLDIFHDYIEQEGGILRKLKNYKCTMK